MLERWLLNIDGRRGEKAGGRETSLAIPFIVVDEQIARRTQIVLD